MYKLKHIKTAIAATLAGSLSIAQADNTLHNGPWTHLFGNHLDTHQESMPKPDGSLKGRLYIIFTGDTDPVSGLPVARHPRGAMKNEECGVDVTCVVGWNLDATPANAKFLYHNGVNGNDHPVWMVNRAEEAQPGVALPISAIPMPGSFTHFHWITTTSTDDRAASVSADCDKTNAGELETKEPTAVDDTCQGWFLQLRAIQEFAFQHGGELIPISPGDDNASHLNIVTNYKALVDGVVITPTR
ncbi:MAG: hypothetical protein U9P00_02885 [Pseudomonadota bacterium]|nr:hypothetical protein [Pseudomonadota bacterium]